MGLLSSVADIAAYGAAGLAQGAGAAAEKVGLAQGAEEAARMRDQRLREWHNEDTIAAEKRAPANAAAMETAKGQATEDLAVANAPAQRARKIADVTEAWKAELALKTDKKNVDLLANAEAAKQKVLTLTAAETAQELAKKPGYLKNLEELSLAQNPEKRAQIAASLSSAAYNDFKLKTEQEITGVQHELANATTPEAKQAAKEKLEGLRWSVDTDRARATADSAVLNSLERSIRDSNAVLKDPSSTKQQTDAATQSMQSAQRTYDYLQGEYAKARGQPATAVTPAGIATPKNPAEMQALPPGTKFRKPGDQTIYVTPGASTSGSKGASSTTAVGEPTTKLAPGAADPNEDLANTRRAAREAETKKRMEKTAADAERIRQFNAGFTRG